MGNVTMNVKILQIFAVKIFSLYSTSLMALVFSRAKALLPMSPTIVDHQEE